MSIAERIRQNSAYVMAGKDMVEQAIIDKGGVVPENPNSGVPTFANLVDGVYSIPSGGMVVTAGNGAKSMEALAQENIDQYDSVKVLVNPNAQTTFTGSITLPTTAIYKGARSNTTLTSDTTTSLKFYPEETIGTAIDNKIRYISPSGNFLVMPSTSSSTAQQREYGAFPFYKVNGEYVQLTINGIYDTFHVGSFAHWNAWVSDTYTNNSINAICIDETTGIIIAMSNNNYRVFKLDLENMNIIPMHTTDQYFKVNGLSSLSNASNPILLGNTLLFEIMNYNSNYRSNACFASFDDTTYTCATATKLYGGSSQSVHCKIVGYSTKADDTIYVVISSNVDKLVKIQNNTVICEAQLPVAISVDNKFNVKGFSLNSSGTKMFILNETSLHSYLINDNGNNITFTETTSVDFADGTFDPTNVLYAYIARDGSYIMAEKIDTSLEVTDNLVMLEYQFGETGGYKIVSYPLKDFAPVLINYPILNRLLQFNDGQNMLFDIGNNKAMVYKAIAPDGKYLMCKSGNVLSNESNLYGFGIAEDNVSVGETGVASMNVTI